MSLAVDVEEADLASTTPDPDLTAPASE